jgi:O-antigen ligase
MIYAMSFGAAVLCFFYAKGGFPTWGTPVPMYDVNDLALMFNAVIPLSVFLFLSERGGFGRGLICMTVLLCAFSVLMTRSRGGFLTLGCIAALFLFYVEASRWLKLAPVVAIVVGFGMLPSDRQERLLTLFNPSTDYNVTADDGRFAIWSRGATYLSDKPVMGVGFRNFAVAEATISPDARQFGSAKAKVTHNSMVEIFVETGFVGGLLYLAMIGAVLGHLLQSRRRMKKQPSIENRVTQLCTDLLAVSVVAFLIGGFFLALGYTPALFALLTIAVLIDPEGPETNRAHSRGHPARGLGRRRQVTRSLRPAL